MHQRRPWKDVKMQWDFCRFLKYYEITTTRYYFPNKTRQVTCEPWFWVSRQKSVSRKVLITATWQSSVLMIESNELLWKGTILFYCCFQGGHRAEAKVNRCKSCLLKFQFLRENWSIVLFSNTLLFLVLFSSVNINNWRREACGTFQVLLPKLY